MIAVHNANNRENGKVDNDGKPHQTTIRVVQVIADGAHDYSMRINLETRPVRLANILVKFYVSFSPMEGKIKGSLVRKYCLSLMLTHLGQPKTKMQ